MGIPSESRSKLTIVPCAIAEANEFIRRHHRHHKSVVGHKFSVAVVDQQAEVRGVAVVGRPVSRVIDDGWTLEVTRCCTDGCKNACSALYAAAWRAVKAMGYKKLITYTLNTETGTSIIAAGWKCVAQTKGGSWNCPSRPRVDMHPLQQKLRWEAQ